MTSTINAFSAGSGGITQAADASGILQLQTNSTAAVTIDTSQNVGLGTSSPTGISTYPTLDIRGSAGGGLRYGSSTVHGYLYANTGGAQLGTVTSSPVIFYTDGTERMRIDSSGNVLVGGVTNFGFRFQAEALSTQSAAYLYRATATTTDNVVTVSSDVSGGGSTRLVILASGNVQNINNSYGAISDLKLKENITDTTPKLEKLNQVRVVNFNFIGDEQKQIGVVAQELEQVFPGMVEETTDRDIEGNLLDTTTKSVKYSVFVPMLIKCIQEQQALITQLQADVAALKGA